MCDVSRYNRMQINSRKSNIGLDELMRVYL